MEVSEIVIVQALLFSLRLASVAISPSERVAETTPEVAADKLFAKDTEEVPELTNIASLPNPLIPDEE